MAVQVCVSQLLGLGTWVGSEDVGAVGGMHEDVDADICRWR